MRETIRAHFRYLIMACCGIQLCWVNPRLPTYCPECGKHCYPQVRGMVTLSDSSAEISYDH
jgi:hypothetical protein